MTQPVTFKNEGLIDLRAISTFGASSKVGDSPIGYFGTGLKYAIAICLREGCAVVMYRGKKKYVFEAKKTRIRVDHFEVVTMNGQELGFTTLLGQNWELWQAFRELWCNTVDENEEVFLGKTGGVVSATTFEVTGEAFEEIYHTRETVMLTDPAYLVLDGVEVRDRKSDHLYYRGIRAEKLRHPSRFTYNVTKQLTLTEDRTVQYPWQAANFVKAAVAGSTDLDFVTRVLSADEGSYEAHLDFGDLTRDPGETFRTATTLLKGKATVNESALRLCRNALRKEMEEHQGEKLEGVTAVQMDKALAFLKVLGFKAGAYPIIVVDALESGADKWLAERGKIFITPDLFVLGTRELTRALLLAYFELDSHGDADLVALLTTRLMTLGEKVTGEPL